MPLPLQPMVHSRTQLSLDVQCRLHAAKEKADTRRRAALYAADHPIDPATGRPFFNPETGRGPAARNKEGMPVGQWLYTKWCAAISAQLMCTQIGLAAACVDHGSGPSQTGDSQHNLALLTCIPSWHTIASFTAPRTGVMLLRERCVPHLSNPDQRGGHAPCLHRSVGSPCARSMLLGTAASGFAGRRARARRQSAAAARRPSATRMRPGCTPTAAPSAWWRSSRPGASARSTPTWTRCSACPR